MAKPKKSRLRSIRPRLIGVLLIPTIAALALGSFQTAQLVQRSHELSRSESLVRALPSAFQLALQLQVERDAETAFGADKASLGRLRITTDALVDHWRAEVPTIDTAGSPALSQDLALITRDLGRLDTTRARLAEESTRAAARTAYTDTLNVLLGLAQRLPYVDDPTLFDETAALAEVRPAIEALGDQGDALAAALSGGRLDVRDLTTLADATSRWNVATLAFARQTTPGIRLKFEQASGIDATSGVVLAGNPMQNAITELLSTGDPASMGMTPDEFLEVQGKFFTAMTGIIVGAADELEAHLHDRMTHARTEAIVASSLILLTLLVALVEARRNREKLLVPAGGDAAPVETAVGVAAPAEPPTPSEPTVVVPTTSAALPARERPRVTAPDQPLPVLPAMSVAPRPDSGPSTWFTPIQSAQPEDLLTHFLAYGRGETPTPGVAVPAPRREPDLVEDTSGAVVPFPAGLRSDADEWDDEATIFAALQTEWFTRLTETRHPETWESPGDQGWQRAAQLAAPDVDAALPETAIGALPQRVTGQHLAG